MRSLAVLLMAGLAAACGVVGPPIAPEMIGAAPVIQRQKQQHEQEALEAQQREKAVADEAAEYDPDLQEHEVELPPLEPAGRR
ncbi:MAG TPA: hypothetical protein VD738_07790 [Nitrospira sp.]|nr:hypothetical protein [Nitrospira sp.]